jgi:hypothetical protein
VLEDANSVQVALMQVMRLILSGQVDPKTAGLLLYALQTASSNLSRINFEPIETRVVIDPRTVDQTPLGEDPWCAEDFEEEEYEEDDQAEACSQGEAKADAFEEDEESSAEQTITNIEGRAGAGQADEQTIARIHGVTTAASRPRRRPALAPYSYPRRAAKDSLAACGQKRARPSHFAGTTSTGPVSLPPPIPLSSEWTCDVRS